MVDTRVLTLGTRLAAGAERNDADTSEEDNRRTSEVMLRFGDRFSVGGRFTLFPHRLVHPSDV